MVISLRIPDELVARLDEEGVRLQRSRNWVAVDLIRRGSSEEEQRPSSPQVEGSIPSPRSKTQGHHPRCKCSLCGAK